MPLSLTQFSALLGGRLGGLKVEVAAKWVNWLLLGLLAYTLAELTWLAIPQPSLAEPPALRGDQGVGGAANVAGGKKVSLAAVARLHLLGEPAPDKPAEAPKAKAEAIDAPETRLNLTLKGVFAATRQEEAFAIISSGSADEEFYSVGDAVQGGAKLHEVLADRVILERNGRFEALTLPKDGLDPQALAAKPSGGREEQRGRASRQKEKERPAFNPYAERASLADYRDKFLNNPNEIMKFARIQPVMDGGQLKGYRLNPGRDRELFNRVGLKPGDIVTSVNGVTLNNPAMMGDALKQLTSSSQVSVSVLRNGRQESLTLSFD